jgi:hypothetical protein
MVSSALSPVGAINTYTMPTRIDHDALRFRKIPGRLVSKGEQADNRLKAEQLAARIASGRASSTAHLHGPVRTLSPEEVAAWAAPHGVGGWS